MTYTYSFITVWNITRLYADLIWCRFGHFFSTSYRRKLHTKSVRLISHLETEIRSGLLSSIDSVPKTTPGIAPTCHIPFNTSIRLDVCSMCREHATEKFCPWDLFLEGDDGPMRQVRCCLRAWREERSSRGRRLTARRHSIPFLRICTTVQYRYRWCIAAQYAFTQST